MPFASDNYKDLQIHSPTIYEYKIKSSSLRIDLDCQVSNAFTRYISMESIIYRYTNAEPSKEQRSRSNFFLNLGLSVTLQPQRKILISKHLD